MERLKNPREFSVVYSQGRPRFGKLIVVSVLPTDRKVSRVGFAVSKKVGNAVKRNKIKRRLRAIMGELAPQIPPNYDLVIGAKRSSAEASFSDLEHDLIRVLKNANLLTEAQSKQNSGGENHA